MKRLMDLTEPELAALMTAMARAIEGAAKFHGVEKPLFILHVFNDPEIAQYIANCERGSAIQAMRECADRMERAEDMRRDAEVAAD